MLYKTMTGLALACLCAASSAMAQPAQASAEQNRKLVVAFYNDFFNKHEVDRASTVVAQDYKQHNPQVADGKKPFVTFFTQYFAKNPGARSRILRTAVDGDLVWMHNHSTSGPGDRGRAIVNIFRVQGGKIVEHWDVIQAVPERAANGNSMF